MKISKFLLIAWLLIFSCIANATDITNLVVFGDSFSDRGHITTSGFNRYSNGLVWPEYLAKSLCRNCLEDNAWGGAKSDSGNYNGFNWSGLLWQVDQFKLTTPANSTLVIIWIGLNDLIDGNVDGKKIVKNIDLAIDQLAKKGVKNIVVMTLPDITIAPAYNNKTIGGYEKYSKIKSKVQQQIAAFNEALLNVVQDKNHEELNVDLIDAAVLFDYLKMKKTYQNMTDPCQGTYILPTNNNYFWWDAWHPMTSVHERVAAFLVKQLAENGYRLVNVDKS